MKHCDWELHFDKDLNQYYYRNKKDNTISFDSPNEVVITEKKSLLRKFSFKRKRSSSICSGDSSNSNKQGLTSTPFSTSSSSTSLSPASSVNSLDDEYLLNNSNNFKNFAGTALYSNDDDTASINSEQSIMTYYSNLDTNEFGSDYYSFDKEKERIELRLQFLKEFAV